MLEAAKEMNGNLEINNDLKTICFSKINKLIPYTIANTNQKLYCAARNTDFGYLTQCVKSYRSVYLDV